MAYWDKFQSKGIPFMENRDKGDMKDILDQNVHIVDFGFIRNEEGDYGVMALAEKPDEFFFANQVITDMLHQVENDGMKEELAKQSIKFVTATSKKSGREYTRFEFGGDIPF